MLSRSHLNPVLCREADSLFVLFYILGQQTVFTMNSDIRRIDVCVNIEVEYSNMQYFEK